MKMPNNGIDRDLARHLLSPNEASSTRIGLHLIELLAKSQQTTQEYSNNPGCCQDNRFLSTNWQQGPITKDNIYTTHWTWRCPTGTYIEHSQLCSRMFFTGRYSTCYQRRNINTKAVTHPLSTWCTTYKICQGNIGTKSVRVTNQLLFWLKAHSNEMEPIINNQINNQTLVSPKT